MYDIALIDFTTNRHFPSKSSADVCNVLTPCVPRDKSYLVNNRRDRRPRCFNNVISTIHHSLVTFLNEEHFAAQVNPHSYYSPDSSIHTCNQQKYYII
jgi:hypothetical protein